MDLSAYRRKIDLLLSDHRHACRSVAEEEEALRDATDSVAHHLEAQKFVQSVAEQVQNQAHLQLAFVVTRCLKSVFGDDAYSFGIRFESKRGKTEATLLLERNGVVLEDPLNEAGGGVVDVSAFALRVACLLMSRPRKRRLLCLDEPFRFVSSGYRPLVRELLETLAEELDLQVVLVTHIPEIICGKVIELEG